MLIGSREFVEIKLLREEGKSSTYTGYYTIYGYFVEYHVKTDLCEFRGNDYFEEDHLREFYKNVFDIFNNRSGLAALNRSIDFGFDLLVDARPHNEIIFNVKQRYLYLKNNREERIQNIEVNFSCEKSESVFESLADIRIE